jgi:hypothetical protein
MPVPVNVISSPPASLPEFGVIFVNVGAGMYSIASASEAVWVSVLTRLRDVSPGVALKGAIHVALVPSAATETEVQLDPETVMVLR